MKRTIQGKRYDTETAIKICEIFEGYRNDFLHLNCTLYQKKTSKEFFIAGFGGAMTAFSSKASDGSITGDEKIIPINDDKAKDFVRRYGEEGQLEKLFPSVKK